MAGTNKTLEQIVVKAWSDAAFKRRLIENPRGVAQEYGIAVPPNVEVRVVENTPTVVHLILPVKPSGDLLSDEQLEAVAGGMAEVRRSKADHYAD